jgi:DNA-binding NtrC family response regulator
MSCSILIALSEAPLRELAGEHLRRDGHRVTQLPEGESLVRYVLANRFDLVITDLEIPRISAVGLVHRLQESARDSDVFLVVPYRSSGEATAAMRNGASGFIAKPVHWEEFRLSVARALERRRLRKEVRSLRAALAELFRPGRILGTSPASAALREAADRLAAGLAPVLLSGERGTGKRFLARVIHYGGRNARGPFLEVDCETQPQAELETRLRGIERGALPEVRTHVPGHFEKAHGGTLHLRGLPALELPLQETIARILRTGEVLPLGGDAPILVEVRVIASTDRPPRRALESGTLLPALHRLFIETVEVPPLRERIADLEPLIADLLRRWGASGVEVPPETLAWLMSRTWPGNFPELEQAVQAALLSRADPARLRPADFGGRAAVPPKPVPPSPGAEPAAAGAPPRVEAPPTGSVPGGPGPGGPVRGGPVPGLPPTAASVGPVDREERTRAGSASPIGLPRDGLDLVELEKQLIREALERTDGNQTQAARLLGLSRQTLIYRMQKHGIER